MDLLSVTDITGHEIEGDVWYTAKASWMLYGLALNGEVAKPRYIAWVWQMKVLFSTAQGDAAPTLLATKDPSPPDTGDELCMKILRALKKRVADVAAGAKRSVVAAQSSIDHLVAEQFSPSLPSLDLATNQLSQKLAADHAALQALVDNPVQRLAQQIAASMPKLDIATGVRQPNAGEGTGEDDAVPLESSDVFEEAPANKPDSDGTSQCE
ncbi:hypothetical protein ACWCPF_41260 [Streptomyces sp. NPDC001858]